MFLIFYTFTIPHNPKTCNCLFVKFNVFLAIFSEKGQVRSIVRIFWPVSLSLLEQSDQFLQFS